MKRIRVYLAICLLALLAACLPSISAGTVIEKEYEPARRWVQFVPVKIGKVTYLQQYWYTDDEDWTITIEKGEEKATIYVDKEVWESTSIGDYVDFGEKVETSDDVTKEKKQSE